LTNLGQAWYHENTYEKGFIFVGRLTVSAHKPLTASGHREANDAVPTVFFFRARIKKHLKTLEPSGPESPG